MVKNSLMYIEFEKKLLPQKIPGPLRHMNSVQT